MSSAGGAEGGGEREGDGALLVREINVAGGAGEAVLFADGRDADDAGRDVEVAGHAADDSQLLEVFFAKVGALWADHAEELCDDRCDAGEVARAEATAEFGGEVVDGDRGGMAVGVDLCHGGHEEEVDAMGRALGCVALGVAGVDLKVFVGSELGRVDEDGGDDEVVLVAGVIEQGGVAAVEVAHGRYESDACGS